LFNLFFLIFNKLAGDDKAINASKLVYASRNIGLFSPEESCFSAKIATYTAYAGSVNRCGHVSAKISDFTSQKCIVRTCARQ